MLWIGGTLAILLAGLVWVMADIKHILTGIKDQLHYLNLREDGKIARQLSRRSTNEH